MLYHALRPSIGLLGRGDANLATARQERAEALAELNGWTDAEREEWLEATRPVPVTVRYSLSRGDQRLAMGTRPMIPGKPVSLGTSTARPVVHDLQVEIAQSSTVADPIVVPSYVGAEVGLLIVPCGTGGWWVEFAGTAAERADEPMKLELGSGSMSGKTRDAKTVAEFGGAALLPAGQTRRWTFPGGLVLELTVEGSLPAVMQAAGRAIRVDLQTLPFDPGLATVLDDYRGSLLWAHPSGLLLLDAETGERAAAELARALAEVPEVAVMASVEDATKHGGTLLEGRFVGGRAVQFAIGQAMDVLVDWDVEVASSSRNADPEFERVFDGWAGQVSLHAMPGEAPRFDWQSTRSHALLKKGKELFLGAAEPLPGEGLPRPPIQARIDTLDWSRVRFDAPSRDGAALVEQLLPGPSGAATVRLEVRAEAVAD